MSFPKIEGFIVTEKLGSGSYSTVYKAYRKVGPRSVVAIKCVEKSRLKGSESGIDNLITEIKLLKTLKHPHIVQMFDFSWDDRHIFIHTEYCNGGDLSKYIRRCGRVQERRVKIFLQQLASALQFLREQGVAHMDLKPHNLLLSKSSDGKYILKVTDFGFAQYMSEETRCNSIRGSPLYMAPEMLTAMDSGVTSYDAKVDLWSVGVIMYECLFGRAPYCSNTLKELLEKIKNRAPIEIPKNASISAECVDLLIRLLQHDPNRRIAYDEFFAHCYLDLDHMPNKENYEMAVNLIKKAIELDSKRQFEDAFQYYCRSLRYLVPFVNSETDPVRRSALRAKVMRYMSRAEELKLILNKSNQIENCSNFSEDHSKSSNKHNFVQMCFNKPGTVSLVIDGPSNKNQSGIPEYSCESNMKDPQFDTGNPVFSYGLDYDAQTDSYTNTMSMENLMSGNSIEEKTPDVPFLDEHDSSINDTGTIEKPKKLLSRENSDHLCTVQ